MDKDIDGGVPNMVYMAYKSFTSLPPPNLKTTPVRPKHSTVNLRDEHLVRNTLDSILSRELEGATIDHRNFIDEIITDQALGFEVGPIVLELAKLQAFNRVQVTPEPLPPNTLPIHHRRNVASETHTADHLNRITTLIGEHAGRTPTRQWSASAHSRPLSGSVHLRKPDIVLYEKDILEDDIDWKSVHSVVEVTANRKSQVPHATLRCKALNIFSAQHSRRYVITVWMTHAHFGATLFDRSGEIKGCWSYTSQDTYVRLIAGLAYGSEELLGYDPSLERDLHGDVQKLKMNNEWYSVVKVVFSSDVLRGRATVCWLVTKGGKQFVVKDTWVDLQRQYKEREFIEACAKHQITNVSKLYRTEEVKVNGKLDSTISRRPLDLRGDIEDRIHCRLLLDPVCTSIQHFSSQRELLHAFIDCIEAHEALVKVGILHRDISLTNLALTCISSHNHGEGCPPNSLRGGVLIDFDYATWLEATSRTIAKTDKTGTLPFIAIEILCPGSDQTPHHVYQHDLESFLYVLIWICTNYEQPEVLKKNVDKLTVTLWNDHTQGQAQLGAGKRGHLMSPKHLIFSGFSPYFHVFCPLVDELMNVLFTTPDFYTSKSSVTHRDFIKIFKDTLSNLPPEPDVPRPRPHKPAATNKRVFEDEDGDLINGSEPIIGRLSKQVKRVRVAA